MSDFSPQNFDQGQQSDIICDEDFENDDLVAFQHDSKKINIFYSQLTKYSKHIRESYLFSDVINRFPQEIQHFQEEFQLSSESIDLFFQLLQQNYNIKEDLILTYNQCTDLLKISKLLVIRKLECKINQYINSRKIDIDFIIQMIQYNIKTQTNTNNQQIEISNEIENLFTSKINECFENEKFIELPIQIIYRVVKQSSPNVIDSNELFDFIIKSLSKFCVLFQFLDLQKLSDDRLEKLYKSYLKSNENTRHCFDYLKCNLDLINEMINHKKNLEKMNDEQRNKMQNLESLFQKQLKEQQDRMKDIETLLQKQLKESEKTNDQLKDQLKEQQDKMKDVESLLQKQLKESEKANDQLKNQLKEQQDKMKDFETLLQKQFNEQLQTQVNHSKNLENQISQLQDKLVNSEKQFKELFLIKGRIVASVEKGIFINAEIDLKTKGPTLDTSKSKIIVSTSDAQYLGCEAYENGEPITSLHMKTSFARKSGKYYVRCIVFNSEGESNEIVSNSVTTSGSSLTFDYEKEPYKISLPQGQYKLEVWGAKGGDGTGNCHCNRGSSTVQGGLGGYSRGILKLNKKETVYVLVGEKGCQSNSSDGSTTKGGLPDGGGTKTGHCSNYTTVPGTGGGSTSIRIGSNTNYTRVIVAGGGGGASGSCSKIDPGGFGGGLSGGNCYYKQTLQSQGAGTQTGSTRGLGEGDGRHGDPGGFGSGATGKYCRGCDSGGGGGGGWYGGGSGGYGNNDWCSSGGGGSGWTFTESSMKTFQSGDSANSSKFALTSDYYLTDAICVGGNEEFPRPDGNGNERGHSGHGCAKITFL